MSETKTEAGDTSRAVARSPLPWRVGLTDCCTVFDANDDLVALVSYMGRTVAETRANTRLIAAAPDLLAACEKAVEAMCNRDSGDADTNWGKLYFLEEIDACTAAITACEAAIAKATEATP